MKKIAILIIILITCTILGLWSPWRGININLAGLFGIATQDLKSGLQVYSLSGTLEIYIDSQLKGTITPEESPYFVDNIEPGEHLVKLTRQSDFDNAYWDFNKLITFEKGTNVVMSYNIGPSESFSEGHIIYAINKDDALKSTQLNVKLKQEGFKIQFDSTPFESVTFDEYTSLLDLSKQHSIKINKSGYEQLEFVILPSNQEERDKLSSYDIVIEAQLMLQPVSVEDISTGN